MAKSQVRISRAEMASLARRYSLEAIDTLIDILSKPGAPTRVRNAAVATLIARGWIKPPARPDDPSQKRSSKLH